MGQKLSLPDLSAVKGNLTSPSDTVDGSAPTSEYMKFMVYPTGGLVQWTKHKKVEAEVRDMAGEVIFTTRPVDGLGASFDLVDSKGNVAVRVGSSMNKMNWIIYRVGSPKFDGQKPDPGALEKTGEECYKCAFIQYLNERRQATISAFGPNPAGASVRAAKDSGVVGDVLYEYHVKNGIPEHYTMVIPRKNKNSKKEPKVIAHWYWKKEKPVVGKDFADVEMAKGSDLALQAAFCVIGHIVNVERRQGATA
jgi:hypothetical protein